MDRVEDGPLAGNDQSCSVKSDVENYSRKPQLVATYTPTDSLLIDRLIARMPLSRRWVVGAIGLILLLIPLGLAYKDGIGPVDLLITYRSQLVYPLLIVYVLVAPSALQKTRAGVAQALRPLMPVDDAIFVCLVNRGCRVSPLGELSALGVGLAINVFSKPTFIGPYAIERYAYASRIVGLSLDVWFIYVVFAMTRLTNTLLRKPISVDIFNLAPFEPIGRQSLWLCLTFVGYMILGLLTLDALNWSLLQMYFVFYGIVIVSTVAIFFVNTRNVHRVRAAAKKQQLDFADRRLAVAYYELCEQISDNQETLAVATEMNALAIGKQEIKAARTWPYNTEMLRTLSISILTPLAVGLSRLVAAFLAGGGF